LNLGANINKENDRGEEPLFSSHCSGNEAIIKYLIDQGADINKINRYMRKPHYFRHVVMEMKK